MASNAALLVLRSLKESGDAFPPLKSAAAGILVIVDVTKDIKENKKELEKFVTLAQERVAGIAKRIPKGDGFKPPADLLSALERLTEILKRSEDEFKRMKSRRTLVKIVHSRADKEKIGSLREEMRVVLDSINFSANVAYLTNTTEIEAPATSAVGLDLNRVPPPPLTHFYGRDEYVQKMVNCIQAKVDSGFGAHLMIQGPGGMGKTSVALAVFHEPDIQGLFDEKRYFVRCEAATTGVLLLSAIASTLCLEDIKQDPLKRVLTALRTRTGTGPTLLVLDNAETFWYRENQAEVRAILQHISSIESVTLILTMRGIELPPIVKWNPLPPLDSLALPAAREAFLAIAPKEEAHPELDLLLEEMDCVPLAVTLLARVSQTGGGDVSSLRQRLKKGQSNLLQLGGDDREDSIAVSIKLSLESQPMKRCPSALRLLSIVAHLPDGAAISDLQEMVSIPLDVLDEAHHTLLRLSLAHQSPDNRLTTLSPIRIYIGHCTPPTESDLGHLRNWYLSKLSSRWPHDPWLYTDFLPREKGNVTSILPSLMTGAPLTYQVVHAAWHFSAYLERFDVASDGKLLELAIERSFSQANTSDRQLEYELSWCYYLLGVVKTNQWHFDEAEPLMCKSRDMFVTLGETKERPSS